MATQLDGSQQTMLKKLAKEQMRMNLLERYYDGDAPLPEGADGQSRAYRRFQKKSRLNMAQLCVAAVRERMRIGGFRTGADDDENGDAAARRLWKANKLDVYSADLHSFFLKFGEAYAIVGMKAGREYPLVTVEDPRQIQTITNPEDPSEILAAVKVFIEAGYCRAYFYYPDQIQVYFKDTDTSPYDSENWMYDEEASGPNPLGEVPVVKFTNMDEKGEYEPYLDIIDRINHMILQRLVIATTQAFKQKWIKGDFPTHDPEGNEVDYNGLFESAPGAMWMLPEGADIGEMDQTNIQDILQAVRADIQDFAAVTRTPMHYLSPDGANQSAEGASLSREGLVFKTEDRIARATVGWSKVMSLMFKWMGDTERANLLDLEPIWDSPERYSLSERADANSKFQDLPFRSRMSLVGQFSPAEIAEMEVERAGDALLTELLIGEPVTPGDPVNPDRTNPVGISDREKAEALGAYIRAGVNPQDAANLVGIGNVRFIDALPITLKPNTLLRAETAEIRQDTNGNPA